MVHKVITAEPEARLTDIARLMRKNRIGSIIITKNRKPVGILTESDFIKLVARGLDAKNAVAKDFMNRNVITCDPSITVIDALMIMRSRENSSFARSERTRTCWRDKHQGHHSSDAVFIILRYLESSGRRPASPRGLLNQFHLWTCFSIMPQSSSSIVAPYCGFSTNRPISFHARS